MDNKLKKIFLLVGDIAVLYLSLYLMLAVRYFSKPDQAAWSNHFWPFTTIFFVWIFLFYISDLYNLYLAVNNAKIFQLTSKAIAVGGLLAALFFYINPNIGIAPKTNLIIYLVIFYLLFILWRRFYNWLLHAYLPKNNIAVVGINAQVEEIKQILKNNPHLGYNIKLVINNNGNIVGDNHANVINDLKNIFSANKIATVVLTADLHQSSELRSALFSCLPLNINFISLTNFYESVTGRVPIDAINQMWFLENLSKGKKTYFNLMKRCFDIVLAIFILVITIIFWPLIALIIKLESRGSAFYRQARVGRGNQLFTIIKFRTMTIENNNGDPTTKKDKRVTKFGALLRATRIDELPQILNVLTGEMSFVGPRPERPELIAQLEKDIPFYRERMLAKPGLTGWDQISGEYHSPSHTDTLKKLQYDLFYIKNRSLYLDLSIILKTITTVLRKSGV
jgi:exopolysaccharide biosynthesis polyprenyl glycosylphosphotransferase